MGDISNNPNPADTSSHLEGIEKKLDLKDLFLGMAYYFYFNF